MISDRWAGPPIVEVAFSGDATAVRRARLAVRDLFGGRDEPLAEVVTLVVSELVSNVVQHTSTGGILRIWHAARRAVLRIEITDTDPAAPASPARVTAAGGRGLQIVSTLADRWGVRPALGGKVVWAEFRTAQTW